MRFQRARDARTWSRWGVLIDGAGAIGGRGPGRADLQVRAHRGCEPRNGRDGSVPPALHPGHRGLRSSHAGGHGSAAEPRRLPRSPEPSHELQPILGRGKGNGERGSAADHSAIRASRSSRSSSLSMVAFSSSPITR